MKLKFKWFLNKVLRTACGIVSDIHATGQPTGWELMSTIEKNILQIKNWKVGEK